ncbi:hypothetical protein BO71DRAFT_399533, partial [Aspergillus ellipticus CBS 707.79]
KLKGGENCLKDYPNNIKGCFGLIILDEAHNLRNKIGDFNLLLTATPFFNNRNRPAAVKEALTTSSGTCYVNLILSKVFLEKYIIHADLDEKM